jgi:hypothetical protein
MHSPGGPFACAHTLTSHACQSPIADRLLDDFTARSVPLPSTTLISHACGETLSLGGGIQMAVIPTSAISAAWLRSRL